MKNISILAAVAAFAIVTTVVVSSATVSAAVEPGAVATSAPLSTVMPVTQELPFDRYWSKD